MKNMECYGIQNHLKECRKCAPVGNWNEIAEEFRKKYDELGLKSKKRSMPGIERELILKFFKPYFQEKMHEISLRELEEEHPLYKKEYNELPEIVDNNLEE